MRKIFFKSILLLCTLIVGSGVVWGEDETYEIVFKTATSDSSSDLGASPNVSNVVSEGTDYVKSFSSCSKMYVGVSGIKLGASNNSGTMNFSLADSYSSKYIKSIKVVSAKYGSDTGTLTLYNGSTSLKTGITPGTDYTHTFKTAVQITSLKLTTSSKRAYITKVVLTKQDPVITAEDVNINADILGGNISYSLSYPDGSTMSAAKNGVADWLTVGAVDAVNKRVAFSATENTGTERSAVVTLTYGSVTQDVTITQAAAATKYAVTFSAPSNGTLEVKRGEDAIESGDELSEGTILTIVATPNDGYNLVKWEYSTNGGSTWNDGVGTTYEVTSAVQFRASFIAKEYRTITYSVNGTETPVSVEVGTAISFAAPASGIPTGYTFKGWSASTVALQANETGISYVTSATCTGNATYYAVMAVGIITPSTWTLDYSKESGLSSSTSWGSYGTEFNYTASDGGTWVVKAYKNTGMQINTGKDASIKIPSCSGNIQSISITCSAAKAVGLSANNYSGSGTITYLAEGTDATSQTLDLSSQSVTNGYIVPKGGSTAITKIIVNYNAVSYANYCTTVPTAAITLVDACTDGEGNFYGTYSNSSAFVVPSDLTISCVGITDGKLAITSYSTGDVVKANTGVMVSSTTSGEHSVVLTVATGTEKSGNLLKPSGDAGITAANMNVANTKFYRLTMHDGSQIGFWWGAAEGAAFDLSAHKAYLAVSTGAGAPARFWVEDEENNATDIQNIEANEKAVKYFENGQLLILRDGITYDALGRIVK